MYNINTHLLNCVWFIRVTCTAWMQKATSPEESDNGEQHRRVEHKKKKNNNFDKSMMRMGEETYQKPPYNIHMCRDMLPFSLNCVTVEWHHIGPDIGVVRFGESGACVRFEVAIGKTAIHLWFRNVGIRQCVYSISLASTIDDLLLCEGCDSCPINTEQGRQLRPGLCARSECEIL